jgi:uncharacterized protein (TIGR02147 family)
MERAVFDYSDYKTYLLALASSRPRGFRKRLAEAMGCQTAYVSQVLNDRFHFSLEQIEAAARFLTLNRAETRFLVLLVDASRAGTASLKRHFEEQLEELRDAHLSLKDRIGVTERLSEQEQAHYYGSWHFAAVHMAVTIPRLRKRTQLQRALRISSRKLASTLEFLVGAGLIRQEGDQYLPGTRELHLPKDSPSIHRHHANWRHHALTQMHSEHADENLHYSSISSLSEADAKRIKSLLTQAISESVRIIKDSPEEQLCAINVDFYRADE